MNSESTFKWRHFLPSIILLCVRWYLRYPLSYRNLEEMMVEKELSVDHTTIYRWVTAYSPGINQSCRKYLRSINDSWEVDETHIKSYIKLVTSSSTIIGIYSDNMSNSASALSIIFLYHKIACNMLPIPAFLSALCLLVSSYQLIYNPIFIKIMSRTPSYLAIIICIASMFAGFLFISNVVKMSFRFQKLDIFVLQIVISNCFLAFCFLTSVLSINY